MGNYFGIIYMCTNLINGKKYIGKTVQPFNNRIAQHKYKSEKCENTNILYNAIRKYGWENFKWEIIDCAYNDEELSNKETEYIKRYNTFYKSNKGYNMTLGGEGTVGYGNINEDIAYQIKELLRDTSLPMSKIGKMFGIKKEIVESIYYGNSWIHVEVERFQPRMNRNRENRDWDCIKLKDKNVVKIKEMLRDGYRIREIADIFNVSETLISHINVGKVWRHIEVNGFKYSKGRKSGYEHANSSLKEDDVYKIKKMIMENKITLTEIAKMYGVNKTTISRIAKGETYKNVVVKGFEPQKRNSNGSKNGMAKLTEKQIVEIKKLIKEGKTNVEIARIFNVKPNAISRIRTGKRWSHINIE